MSMYFLLVYKGVYLHNLIDPAWYLLTVLV